MIIQVSREVTEIIEIAIFMAKGARFEYVTPKLILFAACRNRVYGRYLSAGKVFKYGTVKK